MRYDHIIWDWNGTLLDDAEFCVEVMGRMLDRRGLGPLDVARYHRLFGFPVRSYYERLGFDFEREPFELLADEFMSGYLAGWRARSLRPDALRVSDALGGLGLTQSILSAAEQGLLCEGAAHFGLSERMTGVVGIDDHHASGKIEQGISFLATLDVPPGRVLMVGDTVHDHEVAGTLGIDCALLEGGHAPRSRLLGTGAPVYPSLANLLGAITEDRLQEARAAESERGRMSG